MSTVKYRVPFKANDGVQWQLDIESAFVTASPIIVKGVSEQGASLAYEGDTDDPFTVIYKSTLTINLYNEGQININELQQGQDKDFPVKLYRSGILYWSGFLISDGLQWPFKGTPYSITLTATDGLILLDDIDYTHADLPGRTIDASRCPLNYIRQILFATSNLGNPLPIRWTNDLECTAFEGQDVFSQGVQWATDNEGFYSYQSGQDGDDQGAVQKCGFILENILRSNQCRIFQANGIWTIRRVPDIVMGRALYKQTAGNLDLIAIQSGVENLTVHLGRSGYRFIEEDAVITSKPGIKTCTVTYNATVRENILPNGNQDLVTNLIAPQPLFWGGYGDSSFMEKNSVGPIDARDGFATQLSNLGIVPSGGFFTLVTPGGSLGRNGLPIDGKVMVKRLDFGFMFLAHAGFPYNATTQLIDWSSNPLQIRVIYNQGTIQYFLNQFGFWTTTDTLIPIAIDGMRIDDVAKVDFDAFKGILIPEPNNYPQAGDTSDIVVEFEVKNGQNYTIDNIYLNFDGGNEVYESSLPTSNNTASDARELNISSSFNGFFLSNFMTNWSESDTQCYFRDSIKYTGSLTGLTANAIMRFLYKSSKIFNGTVYTAKANWSFDQIHTIDTFADQKFLPLNATYNIEKCEVNLISMECRNDNVIFTEKYYNSNDQTLSN